MKWPTAMRNLGLLLATAALVPLALTVERYYRGQDRSLAQQLAIHHYERSSWFAMNAGKYEAVDPELAGKFRELAKWHYGRASGFVRMPAGDVAAESERDSEHDAVEYPLLERALKHDSSLREEKEEAAWGGRDSRSVSP